MPCGSTSTIENDLDQLESLINENDRKKKQENNLKADVDMETENSIPNIFPEGIIDL